jgi:hypothetical protein
MAPFAMAVAFILEAIKSSIFSGKNMKLNSKVKNRLKRIIVLSTLTIGKAFSISFAVNALTS